MKPHVPFLYIYIAAFFLLVLFLFYRFALRVPRRKNKISEPLDAHVKHFGENEMLSEKLNQAIAEIKEKDKKLSVAYEEIERQKAIAANEKIRLNAIIEEMGEGVLVINDDREIEIINKRALGILGYENLSVIPAGFKIFLISELQHELVQSKKEIVVKELHFDRPGEMVLMVTLAFISKKSSSSSFVAVLRDVTLEKRVEKMKSDFVANVSHEIRSPMAPMKEALALVIEGVAGEINDKQRGLLTILENNMIRLVRLVNDLLDLSKIEAGRMDLNKTRVDLIEVVKEAAESMRSACEGKGITLEIRSAMGQIWAAIDKDRITQVIINLVANAIKFTPSGGRVVVDCSKKNADEAIFSCEDTGPGIPKSEISGLFDRYSQLAAGRLAKGTGLGLAISKAIVEMHGGKIWVESEEGKGSVFKIALPI